MRSSAREKVESALGSGIRRSGPLTGGCIGEVYRADLTDGRVVVVKVADGGGTLDIEGYMLGYLAEHSALPVPAVHLAEPALLVMDFVEGDSRFGAPEQAHAAELLADLHGVSAERFGLERDTLIGGVHQPNPWTDSWLAFFAEHRLVFMAEEAQRAGQCGGDLVKRVRNFAQHLDQFLQEPPHPSLLHGDVWTTNVLAHRGRITAFLDPAVYHGHPEVELAFTTLFGTFGEPFFERYHELRPIPDGFFELRRDIYNLYPLLVHTRLFGGGYAQSVSSTLKRHGY